MVWIVRMFFCFPLYFLLCPCSSFSFKRNVDVVNNFSVYLVLTLHAFGSGPAGSGTHTLCQGSSALSPLFGVFCWIPLTFPALCSYSFCFCFSPLCSHRDPGEGRRTLSALRTGGWSQDLNCCWGLIWLNRLEIVQSGSLFEKNVRLLLLIFILLHSTV